jgi:hypothetical protein
MHVSTLMFLDSMMFYMFRGVGTPDYPSGRPVMHTIYNPRKSVMNPHNWVDIKVTSSITVPE